MLKTLFLFFTVFMFSISISFNSGGRLKGEGNHTFYTYSKSSNAKITTLSESESFNFLYFKKDLKGESVQFFNSEKAKDLLESLKAKLLFIEKGEDFYCEYYYSSKIKDSICLNGQKVNLHVCYGKELITVGSPLIFGSF